MIRYIRTAVLMTAPLFLLRADFSYDQTTRITGGAMVSMMHVAGAFSKDAKKATEPIDTSIAVKGNRMVHRGTDSAQIIDLDAETITRVHFESKTYSVITFEQMRKAMDDAAKKMQEHQKDQQGDMQFEVSFKDTGAKKLVAGLDTHEVIMTLKMKASDGKSDAKGSLDVVTDMWLAPKVPGYDEVRAFQKRMSEKLNWAPGGSSMMAGRPDMAKAMSEMYKEGSKMDGMPVYEIVKMGGSAEGMQQNANSAQAASTQSSAQAQQSEQPTSVGGALGGALAGRFGLGRKKKTQSDDSQQASSSQAQPSGGAQSSSGSASLMETTIEMSNFSSAPVDGSKFEVPAGFSKVDEDAIPQRGKRGR